MSKKGDSNHSDTQETGDLKISRTKESIKRILEKQDIDFFAEAGQEIAIDVLDEEIQESDPVEQALVAEHLFRKTIEKSIPVGVAGFDESGKQIYVNRVFCTMVGWREVELMGTIFPQPYWILNSKENQKNKSSIVFNHILSSRNFEIQLRRKNGPQFWVLVVSNVLSDSTGQTTGRLVSFTDIDSLKQAERQLKQLSQKLVGAQENERKHISQDLHDSIGGKLAGIKYKLEKIVSDVGRNPETARIEKDLQETLAAVRSTIVETQRVTKKLHPSIMDDLGLLAAVRGYCREFQSFYPTIAVRTDFRINERIVPETIKILVYRVLQESLNNVAKHSESDSVLASLYDCAKEIILRIEDNGKGFVFKNIFTTPEFACGLGFESMKERTEVFGGSLKIESNPGEGTVVTASWPLAI